MSADLLRNAAKVLRERAEKATIALDLLAAEEATNDGE